MSEKVSITKSKLDSLANAIAAVGGTSIPKTLSQMESAVLELTIPPNLQSKTITPSVTQQIVSPDTGYDAFSQITINAMPSGSAFTPAVTITAAPTISVNANGLVTATNAASSSVTPTISSGYISSGTAGTISVAGSNTYQLTSKTAFTYTPTTTDQTIASGQYLTGVQTIKGDANLIGENIKSGVSIFGVNGTAEGPEYFAPVYKSLALRDTISYSGKMSEYLDQLTSVNNGMFAAATFDTYIRNSYTWVNVSFVGLYAFVECNLSTASFPSCAYIGVYAFENCASLTTISFPVCTNIGASAFQSCTKLTTASFPSCTYIGASAFQSCTSLTTISFPVCTSIFINAFRSCTKLTTASFPSCAYIGNCAFQSCINLTTASFPSCTSIGAYAFQDCTTLTTISFPVCTSIGNCAFQDCTKLTTISFPVCMSIGSSAFQSCTSLTTASFPSCTSIGAYAFHGCKSLSEVYFMGSVIPTAGTNIFRDTPMRYSSYLGYFGSIYVPSSLVGSYKTATNWATWSSRIVGI